MDNIKYIKRIDTTNKTNTYIDQQTIEFVLPKNKLDLSAFKIFFDVEIDPVCKYHDNSYLKRFMPRLSSSIIDTMTITKDGEDFQTIKDYNVIYNIINDATKEVDDIDSDRPDTLNYSFIDDDNIAKTICDFTNSTDPLVKNPLKYRCFISSFLGFLGEHSSSILDCSKHEYKIAITLAPKYIAYRGINNTDVKVSFNGGGGGTGAVGKVIFEKVISRIDVVNGDQGYTNVPEVIITQAGGGSGATAEAVLEPRSISLQQSYFTLTSGGSGYLPNSLLVMSIIGGGGTGADAVATVGPSGVITNVTIEDGGSGYTSEPTVSFYNQGRTGVVNATGVFTFPPRMIEKITVTDGGKGYTNIGGPINVIINNTDGGSGNAFATAVVDNIIERVDIIDGGSGYFEVPYVSFSGGDPEVHAKAVATIDAATGAVDSVSISDTGRGFKDILTCIDNTHETNYNYKLTNVFANIDVLPDNTPASSQMTFKHYKTIKGTNNNTKNTTLSHIHKGKLNYLMASFVVLGQNDTGLQLNICNEDTKRFGEFFMGNYGDIFAYEETPMTSKTASSKIAKNLSTENNLDNSLYFKRAGSNIKSSQFFMNGQAITPAMDIPQIYNVAKEFFNNDMSRVKSLASFENEFFVFPMMINQTQEEYSSEIEWICSAGSRKDFNAYPILILCTDKTIEV